MGRIGDFPPADTVPLSGQAAHVADRPSVPGVLVRLAEGVVIIVDKEDVTGLEFEEGDVPTAVDEQVEKQGLVIVVGPWMKDGGLGG